MSIVTILEGPDGAGKTTLGERLLSRVRRDGLRADAVNHGPYAGEERIFNHYAESLVDMCDVGHRLLDRSWIAEPIYGRAFRGGANRISVGQRRMLERLAFGHQAVIVLALPPFASCARNFLSRKGEEYLETVNQLRQVYDAYVGVSTYTSLPVALYDYEVMNLSCIVQQIDDARPLPNGGPGVGHWNPDKVVLLVGDRPNVSNNGDRRAWDMPFISSSAGGCSAWLAERLEELDVPESALYWVNARGSDNVETSARFVDALNPMRVIAMGLHAQGWCERNLGGEFTAIDHPQHQKRFHYGDKWVDLANVFDGLNMESAL